MIKLRELDAGRMPSTAPQIIRQHTRYVAGERPVPGAWLEFCRQTLLSECSGLTAAQLQ